MKNLSKLNGAKALSKNEQINISGGRATGSCYVPCTGQNTHCWNSCSCPGVCSGTVCIPY